MNTEQQRAVALARARRARAEAEAQGGAPSEAKNGAFEGFGQAFYQGIDQPLEAMGTTAEALGSEGLGATLKGATEQTPGYESASAKFMNGDFLGFDPSYLPKALVEQAGQMGGSLLARAGGGALGGVVGSVAGPGGTAVGAAAGAFAGPAVFEAAQILGPVAIERAKNNGRDAPNSEDWAAAFTTASASGALNAIAPGAQGFLKRALLEGGTEGLQSVTQQTGETLATDAGLSIDPKQAIGEGILGVGSIASIDAATTAASAGVNAVREGVSNPRYDTGFTEADRAAADRIMANADNKPEIIRNVSSTDSNTSAQGAAKGALIEARKALQNRVTELRKIATATNNAKAADAVGPLESLLEDGVNARDAIDALFGNAGNMKSSVSNNAIRKVKDAFGDIKEANEAVQLAEEIRRIQPFTEAGGDLGGFGSLTRYLDPFDGRNSGITKAAGLLGLGGAGFMAGATMGALAGGYGVNRAARGIDVLLNKRSKIKRYIESVNRENPNGFGEATGRPVRDILQGIKTEEADKRLAQKQAEKAIKEQAKIAKNAAKMSEQKEMNPQTFGPAPASPMYQSLEPLFEEGATVPKDDPIYEGYRRWEARTGLNPSETLKVLQELETEGRIDADTSRRYRENIYSFKKDKNKTLGLQEMVRQRANPDYRYTSSKEENKALVKGIKATDVKPQGSRRKYRAKEGERRRINVNALIEENKAVLKTDQYVALHGLAQDIDTYEMDREDRQALIDERLPQIVRNPAMRAIFAKEFGALAQIGNDYAMDLDAVTDETVETPEQVFEKKVEEVKKAETKRKSNKKAKKPADPVQPELAPQKPKTKADRALVKAQAAAAAPLDQSKSSFLDDIMESYEDFASRRGGTAEVEEDAPSPATTQVEAKEVSAPAPKAGNRNSTAAMVEERIANKDLMDRIATGEAGTLAQHVASLGKSPEDRVEKLIYEIGSDQLNQNMLTDRYTTTHGIPPAEAARIVDGVLTDMEAKGLIKRFVQFGNSALKQNEKLKKAKGQVLRVVSIELLDQGLKDRVNIAKAVRWYGKMVNQNGPEVAYTPSVINDGNHRAFKDHSPEEIDGSFLPAIDFIEFLRNTQMSFDQRALDQIEEALKVTDKDKQGTIRSVLNPVVGERVVRQKNGKVKKQILRDKGPLDTLAQILFQIGPKAEGRDNRFFQEWTAGRNLRVYSRNGLAHVQGGKIMKGLTRFADKAAPGPEGLKFIFHSFGNLMGADKESPKDRREFIFTDPDTIPNLIKFAENPFAKSLLVQSKDGKTPTKLGKMVSSGESFFEVLNVAHEVKSMVSWARERNPKVKGSDREILLDPKVQADLAANYQTDFIVQLDASNNAYQLAGLAMGYPEVLQATGMAPRPGVADPDDTKGADIYMQPAIAIEARIPELKALGLPRSKLRKVFKNPIGTYLYEAEYNSRKESFREKLTEAADGAALTGIGDRPGLIPIPETVQANMLSEEGHTFAYPKYDANGAFTETTVVRQKVVEEEGKWYIATDKSKTGTGFTTGSKGFETSDEAIAAAFEENLFVRMDRELVRDMNERFPRMRDYLLFADAVSRIAKERGEDGVNVRTPDGMMLRTKFKEDKVFDSLDVTMPDGNVVPMGFDTGKTNVTGRGVAAFMMHQLDAYVLRETAKRMRAEGLLKRGFNPIHDSFGFPPEDAQRGQEIWAEVMQELGSSDFNIFEMIMDDNGITAADILRAKGTVPQRDPVTPVPAKAIPSALS